MVSRLQGAAIGALGGLQKEKAGDKIITRLSSTKI